MPVLTTPVSSVCEIVSAKIAMPNTLNRRIGIITLEEDSIPLFTPINTMKKTIARKVAIMMMGQRSLVMKPLK